MTTTMMTLGRKSSSNNIVVAAINRYCGNRSTIRHMLKCSSMMAGGVIGWEEKVMQERQGRFFSSCKGDISDSGSKIAKEGTTPNSSSQITSSPVGFFQEIHSKNNTNVASSLSSSCFSPDAIIDLFHAHADSSCRTTLGRDGLRALLESIGDESNAAKMYSLLDSLPDQRMDLNVFLQHSHHLLANTPARIVLVVGGPGSGKGLLCRRLVEQCNVVHVSSGDLLRAEVERGTVLGQEVAQFMQRGELVNSAIIVALIQQHLKHFGPGKRVLLDGFPRSRENAQDFMKLCGRPELALHLQCDDTILIERILHRAATSSSSTTSKRSDDTIETALRRIRTYHKSHATTMDWLQCHGVPIVNLDCSGTPENVWEQLLAIGRLMRPACQVGNLTNNNAQQNAAATTIPLFGSASSTTRNEIDINHDDESESPDVPKVGFF